MLEPSLQILQTLVALLLVCGAAVLLIRAGARWHRARGRGDSILTREASLPLGGGAHLHLVRAQDRLLLLGATTGQVRLLAGLTGASPPLTKTELPPSLPTTELPPSLPALGGSAPPLGVAGPGRPETHD
jgi:flagellar biogenesis protein FliO